MNDDHVVDDEGNEASLRSYLRSFVLSLPNNHNNNHHHNITYKYKKYIYFFQRLCISL